MNVNSTPCWRNSLFALIYAHEYFVNKMKSRQFVFQFPELMFPLPCDGRTVTVEAELLFSLCQELTSWIKQWRSDHLRTWRQFAHPPPSLTLSLSMTKPTDFKGTPHLEVSASCLFLNIVFGLSFCFFFICRLQSCLWILWESPHGLKCEISGHFYSVF